ncbi:MAG: hypothetical protein ACJLTB_08085 [Algoriphagus aquaeductus]
MIKAVRKMIKQLSSEPKKLFLIDSIGALTTAFLLFVVLRNFNEYFGMPERILTYLSVIAVFFCIYSTTCFFVIKANWTPFIRIISIANLLYCVLTIGLVMFYNPQLTTIGTAYFLGEIAIIIGLVYIELKVATEIKNTRIVKYKNDCEGNTENR